MKHEITSLDVILIVFIIGVLYASFGVPMHWQEKLIKSTNLEKTKNESEY